VPKDINQAINWYTKASAGGDENGKTNLKRLGR
jgi:TPR repeat protein